MADAWNIQFSGHGLSGNVLFTATDGVYQFTPGLRRRKIAVQDLPLVCAVVAKDGGYSGATHSLVLTWMTTVTAASSVWAAAYAKLQAAWDGVAGTLTVPDLPAMANCVVTDIKLGPQTRLVQGTPLGSASTGFTEGYLVEATITFEQLGA